MRGVGVRMKLNPLPENIRGKKLVVVDDSIVRGTTTRQVVAMLREAGAAEVHFRVSSPPYRWPCFYGMDTGRRGELLAADLSVGEIREYLDVDSLAYLELDRLRAAHRRARRRRSAPRASRTSTRCRSSSPAATRSSCSRPPTPSTSPRDPVRRAASAGRRPHLRRRRGRHRAGEKAVELIKAHVRSTYRPEVIGDDRRVRRVVRSLGARATSDPVLVLVDRRRRHEVRGRVDDRPLRHDRHRPRRDASTTSPPRAPSPSSSSTTCRGQASSPRRRRHRGRRGRGVPAGRRRADRRRDVRAPAT